MKKVVFLGIQEGQAAVTLSGSLCPATPGRKCLKVLPCAGDLRTLAGT